MKKPKNSENSNKGMFLQYFLCFGLTFGSASIIALTIMALAPQRPLEVKEGVRLFVIGLAGILIEIALSYALGSRLFRWYNTEIAIRRAVDTHTTFEDNLMEDRRERYSSIMATAGGFFAAIPGLVRGGWTTTCQIAMGLCLLLFVAALLTAIVTVGVGLRLRSERLTEGDPTVIVWYRYEEIDGNRIKIPRTCPASEVYRFYW